MSPDHHLAREVLTLLAGHGDQLVCAESCTAGLVSATLAAIPGASNFLCGSAVTYRNGTKSAWLHIPNEVLDDPARGAVCRETAIRMAEGVLSMTPEASLAVSITGHLGPNAPGGLDGVAFVGWARRSGSPDTPFHSEASLVHLQQPAPADSNDIERRVARQVEAMRCVLKAIIGLYAAGL